MPRAIPVRRAKEEALEDDEDRSALSFSRPDGSAQAFSGSNAPIAALDAMDRHWDQTFSSEIQPPGAVSEV